MKSYREETGDYVITAASDKGSIKRVNQDYFGIFRPEDGRLLERKGALIAVADGMSGPYRGEKASRMMIDILGESYFDYEMKEGVDAELAEAFREGNRKVFSEVGDGMKGAAGTTCTAAVLLPDSIHLGHVGDSRAYLAGNRSFTRLTEDHSISKYHSGARGSEDGRREGKAVRVLIRSIGVKQEVKPEIISGIRCRRGEILLLCTDGLTSILQESVIAEKVRSGIKCSGLIEAAIDAGSRDNITVIMARKISF